MDFIEKVTQELANKYYEEFVARKHIESGQLRIDELSMQQEWDPTSVSQLLTQNTRFTGPGKFLV